MSEKKKGELDDLEGLDWDSALAEWEEKTFLPEVAEDKETSKPAILAGTPTPPPPGAKPLYRPASQSANLAPNAGRASSVSVGPVSGPQRSTPPIPILKSAPAPSMNVPQVVKSAPPQITDIYDDDDPEESGATVIAAIPRELLRGMGKVDDSPKSARGGLGQMFARGPEKREGEDDELDQLLEETRSEDPRKAPEDDKENAPTVSLRRSDPDVSDEVITSAKQVQLRRTKSVPSDAPPMKRPSQVMAPEVVQDGGLFDPFAEPDPFSQSVSSQLQGSTHAASVPTPVRPPPIEAKVAAAKSEPPPPRPPAPTVHDIEATRDAQLDAGTDALLEHDFEEEDGGVIEVGDSVVDPVELETTGGDDAIDEEPVKSRPPPIPIPSPIPSGPSLHVPTARAFDPNDDTSEHLKGAIHVPSRREYDPNEDTSVLSKSLLPFNAKGAQPGGAAGDVDLVGVGEEEDDEDDPTNFKKRGAAGRAPKLTQAWEDERSARERLTPEVRAAFESRAEWLESEARSTEERTARARALLVVSELRAILGETEQAEILAREASALSPQLALAPRQARALSPMPRDTAATIEALDAEVRQSPTPASRLHGALLAADLLRLSGDNDGAAKRWDQAMRIAPNDPRAPLARAARALATGNMAHPALRLPDVPELASLAQGIAAALKLRGEARPDVSTDAFLPGDALRRAREALAKGDVAAAAPRFAELAQIAELRDGASWLAASLGATRATTRGDTVEWLRQIRGPSEPLAQRAAAQRGVELDDGAIVQQALENAAAFSPADRGILAALLNAPKASPDEDLDVLGVSDAMKPLAAALAALGAPKDRAERVAGREGSRHAMTLGRLLAADAPAAAIENALGAMAGDHDGESRAVALEMAARAGQYDDVSDALAAWSGDGDEEETAARDRQLAAALIAERAGDRTRAIAAYDAALKLDGSNEAALRALIALAPETDAVAGLSHLGVQSAAHSSDGVRASMARIEAVARGDGLDDAVKLDLLEQAHRSAPQLPIAAFLAEHIGRRTGDVDTVLRWIRERRAASSDALENALDAVRESLFVAETDPELAHTRLEEAHKARPSDVALRELLERLSSEPLHDRGAWREQRAAASTGPARAMLFTEAAHEYERAGDKEGALRTAALARDAGDDALGKLALERAELEAGSASRLADELLALARSTENVRERREAYERLADLDATGRDDQASALLWHRSILEASPEYMPSLRYVEHALLNDGRDEELEPFAAAIARVLAAASAGGDGEASAHAALAMRLRMRGATGEWEPTREMAELGASQPEPALWALRAANAHARANLDDALLAKTALALADRTTRPFEIAALSVRAAEATLRRDEPGRARELLERASTEDSGDVVTWGHLAEVRQRSGDPRAAAEACESLARTSVVAEHQLLAWYDAGRIWLDDVRDTERGVSALEQAASLDVAFQDVFPRLSALYTQRGARNELASLLERRLEKVTDADERVSLEVERGRALAEVGETQGARAALKGALEAKPDHIGALTAFADLCATLGDWEGAEQAWVRLSRLLSTPDDQRAIYAKLGELYAVHAVNLSRAEVALKEVLKRAPDDVPTQERLVDVYRRQNDGTRAVETQQALLKLAKSPIERRQRLIELASTYETTLRDPRKAEQALETARREAAHDVTALRALAEFYQRQRQLPAVNIMLDPASADARRALTGGKLAPALFEVMQTVFELRGKRDAARVVAASLAALEGRPAPLVGADGRAGDPRLDDLLASDPMSAGLRALLVRTGDALDTASALDLRALQVSPLPNGPAQARIAALATAMGLPSIQVLVSPKLGRMCVPSASAPPAVVIGEPLLQVVTQPAAAFVITRALKLVQAHASALVRTPPQDLNVLVSAWLQVFNPQWAPPGINPAQLAEAGRRVQAGLPRNLDADVGMIALEIAGTLGSSAATLGATAMTWANRVALLAIGDPNAALDGIAWSLGTNDGAPREPEARAKWAAATNEAKDLLVFSVGENYAELRARLQLDR